MLVLLVVVKQQGLFDFFLQCLLDGSLVGCLIGDC